MLPRILLVTIIGLSSAGLAIVFWSGPHQSMRQAEAAASPHHAMLVAAHNLKAGTLLKPEDIIGADITDNAHQIGAWSDTKMDRAELVGSMIRRSLAPHEVVTPADVMRPGEHGFLAAVLRPGKRAISVGIDAVTGHSGLIWPGDHVDLILTQALDTPSTPPEQRISGATVLRNVRVLAIDQDLLRESNATKQTSNNRTVTLEVSPLGAERVSVAVRLGKLSLVVVAADQISESPAAPPLALPDPVTWTGFGGGTREGDVSRALPQGVANNKATIRVFQGANESKEYHF